MHAPPNDGWLQCSRYGRLRWSLGRRNRHTDASHSGLPAALARYSAFSRDRLAPRAAGGEHEQIRRWLCKSPLAEIADLERLTVRAERIELPRVLMMNRPSGGTADREATTLGALQPMAGGHARCLDSTGKPLLAAAKAGPAAAFVQLRGFPRLENVSRHRLVTRDRLCTLGFHLGAYKALMLETVGAERKGLTTRKRASVQHRHERTLTLSEHKRRAAAGLASGGRQSRW